MIYLIISYFLLNLLFYWISGERTRKNFIFMISIGTAVAFWIFIIEPLLDLVFGTYAYRKFKFWFDINFTKKFAELSPWMVKRSKKAAEYYKNTTDKYQKRQLHEWDRIQKKYNY